LLRSLGSSADAVLIDSEFMSEQDVDQIAAGSYAPVINIGTKSSRPVSGLAHALSLFERYEYVRRLIVTYIGPGNHPLLHCYMNLFPKLGIHLRYLINGVSKNVV